MMRLIFISCFFLPLFLYAQIDNAYFNQSPPGNTAELFAPKSISDEFGNRDMAISPKGDELFYTMQYNYGMLSTILYSIKVNGQWTPPQVADFCGQYKDLEPAFSYDGTKLYFSSNRPLNDTGKEKDYDIWYVTKVNGKWANAINMKNPVNSDKDEYYASVAKNNDIYFTRAVEGREEDIMVCQFTNGAYNEAVSLPDSINSTGDEFNAYVDPNEQYIIFSGYKRKDGDGSGDLYISKKNEKGQWLQARNLGANINSTSLDYCPYITPDKKYFFFTSNRHSIKTPFSKAKTLKELKAMMRGPLNGADNIYWIKAEDVLK